MGWHILASTMIRALAYDPDTRELRVRFAAGGVYRYFDVPAEVVEQLIDPPDGSHGRYFNDNIRDAFEFEEELTSRGS
jgi:hypothetical protein